MHMQLRYFLLSLLITNMGLYGLYVKPASAQRLCFYSAGDPDFPLYVGQQANVNLGRGQIVGENYGSQVNVRQAPAGYHDGTYGVVGEIITVLGYALGPNCETWFKVRFPESRYVGWIHHKHIRTLDHQGGLWD